MPRSVAYACWWFLGVGLVLALIGLLAAANGDTEPERIPLPPPGYHYCVDSEQLSLCPDGTR